MRALKIAGYTAFGLVAAIVVALLLLVVLVDPDDYRDDLARIVERETGRKLTLSGHLKLSIFPWLALETGPAALSDAVGFGDEPFVAIAQARVGARLLPLLRGRIEVGKVLLAGARVRLITDAQGHDNWATLGQQRDGPQGDETATPPARRPIRLPTVAGIQIKDAAVTIENRQVQSRRVVSDFNLTTGRLESGEPFDLTAAFVLAQQLAAVKVRLAAAVTTDLEGNVYRLAQPEIDVTLLGPGYPAVGVRVALRAASLTADIGHELHQLKGFRLNTQWQGEGYPAAGVPVAVRAADLNVNLDAQTLELLGLEAEVAGAHLSGALSGTEILDAPKVSGPLKLDVISPREWLPKLGIELPQSRDAQVLKTLSFAGRVSATRTAAELSELVLRLDDTTAKGSLGLADFASAALCFDLHVDRINADRYLPPPLESPGAATGETPPTQIPVDRLRTLNARGALSVGEAVFAGIKFTQLRLGVNAREGQVRFHPSAASMYGGQYRGDIGIDATGPLAGVSLDAHISGVNFAPLFKDLFDTERCSGKGSANLRLAGTGRTTDDIMRTLAGAVDFKVTDGALEGTDLLYEIYRARALLKQQPVPQRSGPSRTPFSALQGTGTMQNGVLSNNDLNVAMQLLRVTGQGTVDIPRNALDYRLIATVLKVPRAGGDTTQLQDRVDAQIPVTVSGSLSDPKVRPDVAGYLKEEVNKRIEQERDKAEEKVKKKLGDKLKDLLSR